MNSTFLLFSMLYLLIAASTALGDGVDPLGDGVDPVVLHGEKSPGYAGVSIEGRPFGRMGSEIVLKARTFGSLSKKKDIQYLWRLDKGDGQLTQNEDGTARLIPSTPGDYLVSVTAKSKGGFSTQAIYPIQILEQESKLPVQKPSSAEMRMFERAAALAKEHEDMARKSLRPLNP